MGTMRNKKKAARTGSLKPVQGHYGLEFALANMDKDLSVVFAMLEKDQKNGRI